MGLTVTSRPSKDIDGYSSSWNALNLPVQYKFESDLFPTNNVDPLIAIASFSNNGGFLQLTLSSPSLNTLDDETLEISSCNVDSYNGVWRIKEVIDTSNFVLYASFDSSISSGNIQKYYNNYFAEVKVYAGLPSWHKDHLLKPISEAGTLRVVPNIDNDIIASFSGIIKDNVNVEKSLISGIDLNHFTGFYVEFREGYDQNFNGNIETNYTAWQDDEIGGCGVNAITNGDFDVDLSGWSQSDIITVSEPFVWSAGSATSSLGAKHKTKVIYQEVNLMANIEYDVFVSVDRTNSENTTFNIYGTNDLINFTVLYNETSSNSFNVDIKTVPNSNYKYIGYHFYGNVLDFPVTDVSVDNISVTPTVCELAFWGANSSLQFQNIRGGNMYDYISGRPDSKFMTNFSSPTLFKGSYFDLSTILDVGTGGDFDVSGSAELWLNGDDLPTTGEIDEWIDRTGNHIATSGGTERPTSQSGVNGKRGAQFSIIDKLSITTAMDIPQPCVLYAVFKTFQIANTAIISDNAGASLFVSGTDSSAFAGTSFISAPTTTGTDYVVKAIFDGDNSSIYINNILMSTGNIGLSGFESAFYTIGWVSAAGAIEGIINELLIFKANVDSCVLWQTESYLADKYQTYQSSSLGFSKKEFDKFGNTLSDIVGDIVYSDKGLYRISITSENELTEEIRYKLLGSEECNLSEELTIKVDNSCSSQEIYLTWLNSLGGWEYWKFTADKNYSLNISSKETIKRNIFSNWDDTFISGNTQGDVISVNANNEIEVYSQYLTLDEVKAISSIKHSIRVMVLDEGVETTVVVDSDSITVFNDGDDETLHTIRFNIQLPDIQIQSQ